MNQIQLLLYGRRRRSRRTLSPTKRSARWLFASIGSTVVGVFLTVFVNSYGLDSKSDRKIGEPLVRVFQPADMEIQSNRVSIAGVSEYFGLAHYLVVVPVETGRVWVQPGPVAVDPNGDWIGNAYLGDSKVGRNQQFKIFVVVTGQTMVEGLAQYFPKDSKFSNFIVVTRSG